MKKRVALIASLALLAYPMQLTASADGAYCPPDVPMADDTEIELVDNETADVLLDMRDQLLKNVFIHYPDAEVHAVTACTVLKNGYVAYTSDIQSELDEAEAYCLAHDFDMELMRFYLYNEEDIVNEEVQDGSYAMLSAYIQAENLDIFGMWEQNDEGMIMIICNTTEAYDAIEQYIADHAIDRDDIWLEVNEDNTAKEIPPILSDYEMLSAYIQAENLDIFNMCEQNTEGMIEIVCNTTEAYYAIEQYIADHAINREGIWLIVNEDVSAEETPTANLGDVNEDGSIDILDVIAINRAVLGKEVFTDTQNTAADVNHDKQVDAADSLTILKYIVGLIESLEA